MSTTLRIVAFGLGLMAVFGLALGAGRLVGPVAEPPPAHGASDGHGGAGTEGTGTEGRAATAAVPDVNGLTARAGGYALRLDRTRTEPGRQRLTFAIEGSSGRPVTDFDVVHAKRLHLIVVRRDLTGFQHVHPVLDERSGTWSVPVDLAPGTWRVIADFTPTGWEPLVLAEDLHVAGDYEPGPAPAEARTSEVDDYTVELTGSDAPGADTRLTLTVTRNGEPVTDLQPYLGARGHLVALRTGDLGYVHVHPEESTGSGPDIEFHTSFPTHGTYRLFLDFRHEGVVRTAAFTVEAGGAPGDAGSGDGDRDGDGDGDESEDDNGEEGSHGH
jgi:hypothetical protein